MLELHTINPEITKKIQGETLSSAYDTTHGFSDQYLVEHSTFTECLKHANLTISKKNLCLFPNEINPNNYLPFSIPGLEILLSVIFITIVGGISLSFFGKNAVTFLFLRVMISYLDGFMVRSETFISGHNH